MALEIGSIVEGKVTGIAKFGAFVELPDNKVGLVHISEVASTYVNDVHDYLKVNDTVKVKVISVDDKGKIALSIKQAAEPQREKRENPKGEWQPHHGHGDHPAPRADHGWKAKTGSGASDFRPQKKRREMSGSFEDKLSRFLKDSDERLLDLKRNVESKRGGRGARRAD